MQTHLPGLLPLLLALPGVAQDAERATHTDSASTPQVSFEAGGKGWTLRQYQLGCLSHLSYLIVAGGSAAVVDPQRDVDHYLRDAQALGAEVRHVLLTHPHADFVAGHTEIAHRTGAEIAISALADAEFPHRALHDGDRIAFGGVSFEAWATPGHTPNAMTFLLRVPGGGAEPAFALTGDTLFVGSIGRPDLLDVPPAELAAKSFASVKRLKSLPDATVVLPAHGAGSLCGAHLSPETTSTIGREKATNPYLQIASEATFVANVISHQPVAPQYFAFNVEMNRKGPPLVERDAALPAMLDAPAIRRLLADGAWVVDLRDQQRYADAHLEGSINVALRGRLDTWTGIVVPFGDPLLLVGDDEEAREGVFRLRRIGYDRIAGRIAADADAWRRDGLPVRRSEVMTAKQLFAAMQAGKEPLIVDVRSADEYQDLRLGDVGNIPVTESERFAKVLDKKAAIVMVCNSAYRSSMAIGLAERLGFTDVRSLDGGLDAWVAAGLPTVGRMAASATTTQPRSRLQLPEPIDAAMLGKILLEQPAAYTVIDLRPDWQFREWSLPGAVNVAIDDLAGHLRTLPGDARVVLVDRDGSIAFAVAGALMQQDGGRLLRVLFGGLQQYHRMHATAGAAAMPRAAAIDPAPPAPAPQPQTPPTSPKKRSAGC
ncbi:MAG: MBL fold metallo-hydrolase [Planctomycetes bacterium]|nr:MBL fold metallo-hydrolase [Planctomycetota bacterium]